MNVKVSLGKYLHRVIPVLIFELCVVLEENTRIKLSMEKKKISAGMTF